MPNTKDDKMGISRRRLFRCSRNGLSREDVRVGQDKLKLFDSPPLDPEASSVAQRKTHQQYAHQLRKHL